jgi:mono/diheme cytochrome c family protein
MMTRFLGLLLLGAGTVPAAAEEPTVTFTRDVAPILWKNCADCHHPGQVGPFPLLTYKDAAKRAKFIADITARKRMPPWKAEPNFGAFHGERRLTDDQIKTLARWAAAGTPEGDPKDLPPRPRFPQGWQLGREPDLILAMPQPYKVPAGGPDVYRCFVIPLAVPEDRTVSAVEFHPGNRRVVHHASFYLDAKGQGRRKLKEKPDDGQPGYTNIGGPGFVPDGQLGGWGLAALPRFLPEGAGMLLPRGSDLILQVHYHPNGKEETDRSVLGIYYTRRPARQYVTGLFVRHVGQAPIPAGERNYPVKIQSDPLPAEVVALSVTPHMHNLGREVKVTAHLPNGETLPMVWIKDWDFDWQEVYDFETPPRLPKGTVLKAEVRFDNSVDNPKNPNHPPRTVRWGNNISDEMFGFNVQVITDRVADLRAIESLRGTRPNAGMANEKTTKRR